MTDPQRMAVEYPLRGIVGVGKREAVGILFAGDLGPAVQVEGNGRQRPGGNLQRLVNGAYVVVIVSRLDV